MEKVRARVKEGWGVERTKKVKEEERNRKQGLPQGIRDRRQRCVYKPENKIGLSETG